MLSSSPLLSSANKGSAGQQYSIKLQPSAASSMPVLEVVADKAITKGSHLTIKVGREQVAQIINIKPPQLSSPTNTNINPATINPAIKEQAAIDGLLRQALPVKQATVKLLPLLQLLTSSAAPMQALPKPLTQAMSQLLSLFPDPESLQKPSGVKKAITNNGTFLESKIAELIKLAGSSNSAVKEAPLKQLFNQDIKGQVQQLIKLVDQLSIKKPEVVQQQPAKTLSTALATALGVNAKNRPSPITSAVASESAANSQKPELAHSLLGAKALTGDGSANQKNTAQAPPPLLASALPLIGQPLIASQNTPAPRSNENLDLVLKQLSRQLMSSLSQTQVYQAETLSNRGPAQADGQQTINNWALELPVFNGKQFDNIDLRIRRDTEESEQDNKAAQWTIMLSFDLHSLGKVKVQLSVVAQSVSATVWSESEQTHLAVKQHIDSLQKNFEQVGVHVKRLECLLGQPPEPKNEISQQLVDTHS